MDESVSELLILEDTEQLERLTFSNAENRAPPLNCSSGTAVVPFSPPSPYRLAMSSYCSYRGGYGTDGEADLLQCGEQRGRAHGSVRHEGERLLHADQGEGQRGKAGQLERNTAAHLPSSTPATGGLPQFS